MCAIFQALLIHCIPVAIHPNHSTASQWIRRSFSEKQFDRIPRELFYEISRRFHSFEAILLSFLYGLCLPGRDKAHIHDVPKRMHLSGDCRYPDGTWMHDQKGKHRMVTRLYPSDTAERTPLRRCTRT